MTSQTTMEKKQGAINKEKKKKKEILAITLKVKRGH